MSFPLIAWSDTMSVGVAALDDDHKKVISMINRLHEAITEGHGKAELRAIVNEIVAYADLHFLLEETILEETGYKGIEMQRKQHRGMAHDSRAKQERFNRDEDALPPIEMLTFLRDWWLSHIQDSDKRYTQHLNACQVF